jgi:hypothetical protein
VVTFLARIEVAPEDRAVLAAKAVALDALAVYDDALKSLELRCRVADGHVPIRFEGNYC